MGTYEDLNREIQSQRMGLEKMRRAEKLRVPTKVSLDNERQKLESLTAALQREQRDVQKLEGLSLTGLFHTLLGDKDAALDKERQELLAAKLKADQSAYQVQALQRELDDLTQQASGLAEAERRYQGLMAEKEAWLARGQDAKALELQRLNDELAAAQGELREVDEAVQAGQAARDGLHQVLSALDSARNWGTFDMMGGDLLATAVKHARIDDARQAAHQVQFLLGRFQRELADLRSDSLSESIQVGGFETFADYFFDNLIADWIVQSKIENARQSVGAALNSLDGVMQKLTQRQTLGLRKVESLRTEKNRLVEQAQ